MPVATGNGKGLSWGVGLLIILICLWTLFLNNGIYLVCCLFTIFVVFATLWKTRRPGVLVFAFLLQWIQVIAYVIWMIVTAHDINFLSPHAGTAVVSSCVGLIVMAVVLSWGIRPCLVPSMEELRKEASKINEKKIFILYLFFSLFISSIMLILRNVSGLTQIVLTFGELKWVFFLLFAFVCWINKKNRFLLLIIIVFEFASGLFSYFSSFKEVLLYTLILSLTFVTKIKLKQIFYGLIIGLALGFLMLTWTAIKSDYRSYLNQGTRQQVVAVSKSEAFGNIGEQVSSLSADRYAFAINMLLYRVQYTYHLALTMDRVPDILPYEYGGLWWQNVSFVLMPRILFPNKPLYEATVKTNKYTGKQYAGLAQGSSFSLGYYADSYIDFGYVGMFFPLAMIALFVVFIYRTLYNFNQINLLMRYSLVNVCLYEYYSFEADGLFLFGRLLVMFLVFWFLCKIFMTRLQNWLYK